METKECIKTRRSIRAYTEEPITEKEFEEIVSLAICAPTWKNTQTVRYIAVRDAAMIKRISEECFDDFPWNQKNVAGAPALIALTTVEGKSGFEKDGSFSTPKKTHWQSFDAGIAAQTFCLAAHELGLGTLIMGIYDEEKVSAMLEVPEGQTISALIAIGHPAQKPEMPKRKAVEEVLSYR